jgi:hypothetical protein
VRSSIEEQEDAFKKCDLEALLSDIRELVALVEGRLPEAIGDGGAAAEAPDQAKQKKRRLHSGCCCRRGLLLRQVDLLTVVVPDPVSGTGQA